MQGNSFLCHQPLVWIHRVKDLSVSNTVSRLMRRRLKLEEYEFDIRYKTDINNKNANALSRNPIPTNFSIYPIRKKRLFFNDNPILISDNNSSDELSRKRLVMRSTTEQSPKVIEISDESISSLTPSTLLLLYLIITI